MKQFFIDYGRYFLLAFVLGFLIPRFELGGLQASASDYDKYSKIDNLDEMIETFHKDMNEATNKKIKILLGTTTPNVLFPASDDECGTDNASTYCLAVELNSKLLGFEQALLERKDTLEELQNKVEDESQLDTLTDAIQFANQQSAVVDEQMANAEAALDLTLAVYNQIQTAWPLHKELEKFRNNLEGFRDNLAKVRNVIEGYPNKFNGASTAQCK